MENLTQILQQTIIDAVKEAAPKAIKASKSKNTFKNTFIDRSTKVMGISRITKPGYVP